MTRRKLIDYIKHPYLLQELSIEELQQWVEDFPYSQNLRILLAQKVKSLGLENEYPEVFHNAAMYSTDRDVLYDALDDQDPSNPSSESEDAIEHIPHGAIESSEAISITELVDDNFISDSFQLTADDSTAIAFNKDIMLDEPLEIEDIESSGRAEFEVDLFIAEDESLEIENIESSERVEFKVDSFIAEDELHKQQVFIPLSTPQDHLIVQTTEVDIQSEELVIQATPEAEKILINSESDIDNMVSREVDSESLKTGLSEFSKWLISIDNNVIDQGEAPEEADEDEEEVDASSESLANLFADQGHRKKAIEMYEKLILINPEKSSYFAAQIEKIKES